MKELDVVRLKSKFCDLPTGTTGTIVLEYDGKCFEVEFFDENGDIRLRLCEVWADVHADSKLR